MTRGNLCRRRCSTSQHHDNASRCTNAQLQRSRAEKVSAVSWPWAAVLNRCGPQNVNAEQNCQVAQAFIFRSQVKTLHAGGLFSVIHILVLEKQMSKIVCGNLYFSEESVSVCESDAYMCVLYIWLPESVSVCVCVWERWLVYHTTVRMLRAPSELCISRSKKEWRIACEGENGGKGGSRKINDNSTKAKQLNRLVPHTHIWKHTHTDTAMLDRDERGKEKWVD